MQLVAISINLIVALGLSCVLVNAVFDDVNVKDVLSDMTFANGNYDFSNLDRGKYLNPGASKLLKYLAKHDVYITPNATDITQNKGKHEDRDQLPVRQKLNKNIDHLISDSVEKGFKSAQTALQDFLPLLKKLVLQPDFVERVLNASQTGGTSRRCMMHLIHSVESLMTGHLWAARMYDSWGKPGTGLVQLYGIFRGEYLECTEVKASKKLLTTGSRPEDFSKTSHIKEAGVSLQLDDSKPMFRGKYCHFGASSLMVPGQRTTSKVPPIVLGPVMDMCVPDSCSEADVTWLVNTVFQTATFHKDPLEIVILPAECREKEGWSTRAIVILIVFVLVLSTQIACTAYDVIFIQIKKWRRDAVREKFKQKASLHPGTVQDLPPMSDTSREPLLSSESNESLTERDGGGASGEEYEDDDQMADLSLGQQEPDHLQDNHIELTWRQETAQIFSIYTNSERLLDVNTSHNTMTCIHGIRVICMGWIVLGNLLVYQMVVVANSADFYFRERKKLYTLLIANYLLAVNAFFVISGTMVGYSFQRLIDHSSSLKWSVYALKRYLRLVPPIFVMSSVYVGLWPFLGQGPVYPTEAPDQPACQKNWYLTALLVNNYVDIGDICFAWTWYISAEFQFYLLCPLFMIPLAKGWRKTGVLTALTLVLTSIILTGVISHEKKLPEMELQYETEDGGIADMADLQNFVLIKPYCRVSPYIIGLLLGYVLSVRKDFHLPTPAVLAGWIVCKIVAIATVLGVFSSYSHHQLTTVTAAAVYNAVKDTCFGLAVAWIIFACVTGHGGPINAVLSWRAMVPPSRISYCVYLINIPIIYVFIYSLEGAITMTEWTLVVNFCGVLTISILVSIGMHVLAESPMLRIQKKVLNRFGY